MANLRQFRNSIFGLSLGAATAALAIAFLLIAVASQPSQAQTFKVLHTFTGGADGTSPFAGLTLDKAGNLYGTTNGGGAGYAGYGTAYQLKHKGAGWTFNPLYSFKGSGNGGDGANPQARVIFGPNGTLYGTTSAGGGGNWGTVFNLRPSASACKSALCPWTETVLYAFGAGFDEKDPGYGDLLFDQAGNIYGTTLAGGNPNGGVVYELTPSGGGWTKTVLHEFSYAGGDGVDPYNGVIFDNAGNLYGTTGYGGSAACYEGCGVVYKLTPSGSGWIENVLYGFQGGNDGAHPYAGLILDPSGNLYGATVWGGSGGSGTVFMLTPSGSAWKYTLIYSFTGGSCGNAGRGPWGTLVMDGAGNLYGTTYCDGAYNFGNVWELSPSNGGWTYTSLHDFTGGSDGGNPVSNVVFDTSGNLYGTASTGGATGGKCGNVGCGVVWEITP